MAISQWLHQASEALSHEQPDQAIALYEQCIEAEPDEASHYWRLGLAQLLAGDALAAESTWVYVLAQGEPDQVTAWTTELVGILLEAGDRYSSNGNLETAEAIYRQALQQSPSDPAVHHRLAGVLVNRGEWDVAFNHAYVAVRLDPQNLDYLSRFARCLPHLAFATVDAEFLQTIEHCFDLPEVDQQTLGAIATYLLKLTPEMTRLLHDREATLINSAQSELEWLFQQSLLQQILIRSVLVDPEVEIFLTHLRKQLLERSPDPNSLAFVAALAVQCFNNEYVFAVSAAEEQTLQQHQTQLKQQLLSAVTTPVTTTEFQLQLATIATYLSLHTLCGSDRLLEVTSESWHPLMRLLVKRSVRDRQQEQTIQTTLQAITPIQDEISLAVQTQYEENPYPRWISLPKIAPRPLTTLLTSLLPHFSPPPFLQEPLQVLVAGCGTGKHAIDVAQTYENSNVVAVDLSRASLAYASRMATELGVQNITFYQGDILELGSLQQSFAVIESVGVLHHLDDPVAGWRVLVNLLKPMGIMRIALYNDRVRQPVQSARAFIAKRGFEQTTNGIRQARQAIFELNTDDLVTQVMRSPDFYSLSGCRDLIFHVQEQNYTLPQIAEILEHLGLHLIGLEPIAPDLTQAYKAQFPDDPTLTNLTWLDQFEATHPTAFSAMYRFWCQKG
ncbi:methyltransferase domain-containing protein [Oscillatoria sp. FACHB-1407]|uniref:class I SAM-dependent methyltransferase n=1 Tax=Oscillatoria sp. FACHB-1407 TaxID=2692847 RepID=UPI001689804D|nr:class I SAM-dependent methyltransferase [Oscillatoria sp. FACHB-1407]MBD2461722.1 methyltransferase domain-containing protein [Oscillatoria sp. FACHB-1407]